MSRPNDQEFDTLKWLLEHLTDSEAFCRPYFERAKRHYQLYRFGTAVKSDDWPYVNKVRSRDILAFIEDTTALMLQTLFATMPFFSVIPRETRLLYMKYENIDPMVIADQLSRALDYQICHEDTEFFSEMVDLFKSGAIYGNGYIGIYPKFTAYGYLRPLLKTIDFWDVLPVVGARRISKARGIFVREFVPLEELRDIEKQGIYKGVSELGPLADPDTEWHKNLLQDVGLQNYLPASKNIEIFHYFSGGNIITFGNRKRILRDTRKVTDETTQLFPFSLPIVQYKYMPVPLEFFAMGIPEVLEVLQEDKNLIRSGRRDNIDLVMQKVIKARSGVDLNFDLFKFYPGAIWPMENLNDIEALEMRDVTQSSYQEEALRQQDMENALSLFGYARGMTPRHSEQPMTVMKLQQASLNRMDLAVKLAEFDTLQNIATRIILLTHRYMKQDIYEAIIGDQDAGFYKLTEEDIRRFFHFKPVGSSITAIKELRQQQIQAAIQLIGTISPEVAANNIQPFTVDWYEAVKTALDALDLQNIDRILIKQQMPPVTEEEISPEIDLTGLAEILYGGA